MLKVIDMEKRKGDMVKFLILKWLDVTPHENLPTMAHRVHVAVHWWWVDRQPIAIPIKLVTGGLSLTCFRFVSTILLSFWSFFKIKNKNISIVNWKFLHNNEIIYFLSCCAYGVQYLLNIVIFKRNNLTCNFIINHPAQSVNRLRQLYELVDCFIQKL
jgi:hypothetical protein